MNTILITGLIGFIIGFLLLILSNIMYMRRTHDKDYLRRVWLSKEILTDKEHLLNRTGFAITYGIAALWALYVLKTWLNT